MSTPRITVGVPAYKGTDLIATCLEGLQRQTFRDFEVIISIDGNDRETAAACDPFLSDPRFRMIIQRERLDWVGNFNWLLQQDLKEFFCYRQHDDTTAPEFFEVLLQRADKEPLTAAVYCDCQYTGMRNFLEIAESIQGEPLNRVREFVERLPHVQGPALRGLIRTPAIRQAGNVRSDEFRAPLQAHGWLAKLLRWGGFTRVDATLYYRVERSDSFTTKFMGWAAEDNTQAVWMWTTMFTGLLDAVMPLCRTAEERLFFQQIIVNRIVAYPNFGITKEPSAEKIITACLRRLKHENNTHLLRPEEFSQIADQFQLPLAYSN